MTSQLRHHDVTTEGHICPSSPLNRDGHICPFSPIRVKVETGRFQNSPLEYGLFVFRD